MNQKGDNLCTLKAPDLANLELPLKKVDLLMFLPTVLLFLTTVRHRIKKTTIKHVK